MMCYCFIDQEYHVMYVLNQFQNLFSTLLNLAYTLDISLDELFKDYKYKIPIDDN